MKHRATAWRRGFAWRGEGVSSINFAELIGVPIQMALTHSVRRLARRRPEVFDRLGPIRDAAFLLCPDGIPLSIRLERLGAKSTVRLKPPAQAGGFTAKISGPLPTLLGLFDGSVDADSAFFSRRIKVEGDTAAVIALHNALDAAELGPLDLIPCPEAVRKALRTLSHVYGGSRT